MVELGKQLLIKDNLLDAEAADEAERSRTAFMNKLDHVDAKIDDVQTRFGRLIAERGAAVRKLENRLERINKLLTVRGTNTLHQ